MNWFNNSPPLASYGRKRPQKTTPNNNNARCSFPINYRYNVQDAHHTRHSNFCPDRSCWRAILRMATLEAKIGKLTLKDMAKKEKIKTLAVKDLDYNYPNSDQILHGLNFEVKTNEVLCQ